MTLSGATPSHIISLRPINKFIALPSTSRSSKLLFPSGLVKQEIQYRTMLCPLQWLVVSEYYEVLLYLHWERGGVVG